MKNFRVKLFPIWGFLFFSALLLCAFSPAFATGKSLVRLENLSKSDVVYFYENCFDVAKSGSNYVEVVLDPTEKKALPAKFLANSKTLIPDLDKYIENIQAAQTRGSQYFTYDTMTAKLQEWAKTYSNFATLSSIGKSWEGRDIWALKLTGNTQSEAKKPSVLIMGAHHSREWISFEVPMEACKRLVEGYGKDANLTRLVNERNIWFVPMVNPDGVTYSQTKSQYWRKNRRKNDSSTYGVDLNRNYGYQWGGKGASADPSNDTYRGPTAFSEPESQAIKALAEKEHFQASISFHSYSELVLYPFGYDYNVSNPDNATFKKFAGELAAFNKYTPENSSDLYAASGDSDDWLYGQMKDLAFTFELATTFIPPANQISQICDLNVPAVFYLIDKAGPYAVTPTGNTEILSSLDSKSAMEAVLDGQNLLNNIPEEYKYLTMEKVNLAGERLSKLCSNEMQNGNHELFNQISTTPGLEFVKSMVQERQKFSSLHGE
ncbi:MAG: zinc carboxypeptidase [Candidatus Riflebacteria bacterium]|nr:zinc carboxypeptidase [Candidatus Riflebacteria bacterium]